MEILDTYFKSHKYPITSHQLDSYREFLRTYVPNIIKEANPISMIKLNEDDINITDIKIDVYIGGEDGQNIYIDRPILNVDNNKVLLTPNEARIRNLTYQTNIYGDIHVKIFEGKGQDNTSLDLAYENTFENIVIGNVPIMGGYFIIDGKEKVIVSQERMTSNTIMTETLNDDTHFSHKATILSKSETGSGSMFPRKTLDKQNDDEMLPGTDISPEERDLYSNFLRNTFINNGGYDRNLFEYINGNLKARKLPERTFENLKGMLLLDLFPNIENFEDKAKYLAYIVKQFMLYILGLIPETDKDSYTYKRIDVGGNMLAELFKETYDKYTKYIQNTIDKFYNYGS
eukprot:768657-Hanusia_phi.AAC.2